jgi:hypothetical protein
MSNKGVGPFGQVVSMEDIRPGDLIQLSQTGGYYTHSLLVVETGGINTLDNILIATHTDDSDYRPLSTYNVAEKRFIRIEAR